MAKVNEVADLALAGRVAVLTIDSPPVNALSVAVRRGLLDGIEQAQADDGVAAILIICRGRTFFAGADIKEFAGGVQEPSLAAVQKAIEFGTKPVVAAIHGTALGGGLEVALACHYRVAVPSARLGLPEVALGLLPGAGGTQRLPRIVGAETALDMMVFGKPVSAQDALVCGLVDLLVEEDSLRSSAIAFAEQVIAQNKPLKRVRDLDEKLDAARSDPALFDRFRARHNAAFRGFRAQENIIKAVEAAVQLPFDEGLAREAELFGELISSSESAAQRYYFFAERQAAKIPDLSADGDRRTVRTVGVIGAGTMGSGIAMNFLSVGIPVTLVETSQDALERGVRTIRKNYEASARKGRIAQADVEVRMALLTSSLNLEALASADLIIEAVYEDLELKKSIFRRLDGIAADNAILATNTSFLDLNEIAEVTGRPENVVGLHFFSPAHIMRLLEIGRGQKTSSDVLATVMDLSRKIGKVAVLSKASEGFIANRVMTPRSFVADELILRGPLPWDVDRALVNYGFPMGQFATLDLVGLDVIGWDREKSASASVREVLCEIGRWGQKKDGGYYDYDENRRPTPSPLTETIVREFASKHARQPQAMDDEEIIEWLLYPVVNEAAKILEEGVALRSSDIDVALITGYGWPVYRGGPMFWADEIGLGRIVDRLEALSTELGDAYKPAALLKQVARDNGRLRDI